MTTVAIAAIFIGLVLAIAAAGLYVQSIRDTEWIPLSCFGLGVLVFGLGTLIFAPIYGLIFGVGVTIAALVGSLHDFEGQGEASVFQPVLFRSGTALDPREWAIVFPGLRMFWISAAKLVAKVQTGNITVTGDTGGEISVNFRKGVGTVRFRIDAATPVQMDPSDPMFVTLMERFIRAVPSGKGLDDSAARAENIRSFCTTRIKRLIEAASENISVFDIDAGQLQAAISAAPSGGGKSPLEQAFAEIEAKVGLPASLINLEIEDAEPGEEAKKVIARNATNDAIREKAVELLNASGVAPVDDFILELVASQRREAATYNAMSPAELDDVSGVPAVTRLRKKLEGMMKPDGTPAGPSGTPAATKGFVDLVMEDKKTSELKKAEAINAYRAQYSQAQAELEVAEREERTYRKETIARDKENVRLEGEFARARASDPKPKTEEEEKKRRQEEIKKFVFSKRLFGQIETYRTLYGKVLQDAVDKTAAADDTSRVSIEGLEGLNGARGLEALHVLAGKVGK